MSSAFNLSTSSLISCACVRGGGGGGGEETGRRDRRDAEEELAPTLELPGRLLKAADCCPKFYINKQKNT